MIFTVPTMNGINAGTVTVALRRWAKPRVKPGSRIRNSLGVVEIVSVDVIDAITDADARAAGFANAADAAATVDGKSRGGSLYRIGVRYAGDDPRRQLRQHADLDDVEMTGLRSRLARMDRPAPWTESYLRLIADNPGRVSTELAAEVGFPRPQFKLRVRRLKELGLTESLEVGYRISPRGAAYLARLGRG